MSTKNLSKGETTRSQILDIAYHLFLQNGFAGTSVREIANAASLTVGGIYAHFASKEHIWAEVFDTYHPYHQMIPSLIASEGDHAEALFRDAARRIVKDLEKREDIFNLMMIELVEFNGKHIALIIPNVLPHFTTLSKKFLRFQGNLRNISPTSLARAFMGLFFAYYATDHFIPPPLRHLVNRERALGEFIDIFLFGILTDDDPARRSAA